MSSRTLTILEIVNSFSNYQTQDINEMINLARPEIFNFDYPIHDPLYKEILEKKILVHYLDFEICFDLYGKWKFYLQKELNEIMPYYTELYKTTLFDYNPLYTSNLEKTIKQKGKTETEWVTESENFSSTFGEDTQVFEDTPQGRILDIENVDLATTVNLGKDQSTATQDSNTTNTGKALTESDYIEKVVGKDSGVSYQSLVKEFRDNLLNIDMEIIEKLKRLFILTFDPEDSDY